jgi:hypothetical protein
MTELTTATGTAMAKEQEQAKDKERLAFAALPPVSELALTTKAKVMALLELLDTTLEQKARLVEVEEKCKAELEQLQRDAGKEGFRHGWLCYAAQDVDGRKTLDKMLLLEHGVSAKTIATCYKTGNPSVRRTFKRLSEE